MGLFTVVGSSQSGILKLVLEGAFSEDEMAAFVKAHDAAIDAFRGADYRVFCDIRGLLPLSPECARRFERAKAYSASRPNFRGSAVWATGALVAMQHRRTSEKGGVLATELISDDEAALWSHLRSVNRTAQTRR